MNSKEALENIVINFDNMGMICSNLGYEEFYAKDLHFKEIFKTEYESIFKDLDRLEKLEKENKELIVKKNVAQGIATKLKEENDKLKKVIWILKDHLELYLAYQKIDDIEFYSVMSKILGMCLLNTNKNTYELLKEVLENDLVNCVDN